MAIFNANPGAETALLKFSGTFKWSGIKILPFWKRLKLWASGGCGYELSIRGCDCIPSRVKSPFETRFRALPFESGRGISSHMPWSILRNNICCLIWFRHASLNLEKKGGQPAWWWRWDGSVSARRTMARQKKKKVKPQKPEARFPREHATRSHIFI